MTNSDSQKAWDYLKKKKNEQGHLHFRNYFLDISKTESFLVCIKNLRKKYNIPQNGFSKIRHTGFLAWSKKYNETYSQRIYEDIYKVCKQFFFPKEWWKAIMESLFHDSVDVSDLEFGTTSGMCIVSDLSKKRRIDFPVTIEINPYASQRQILDFIKISYTNEIKPILMKYRSEKSKVRKFKSKNTDIQKRNEFIYKNQNLPRKELISAVKEKFGKQLSESIDQGSIGKIVFLENKKRKDV